MEENIIVALQNGTDHAPYVAVTGFELHKAAVQKALRDPVYAYFQEMYRRISQHCQSKQIISRFQEALMADATMETAASLKRNIMHHVASAAMSNPNTGNTVGLYIFPLKRAIHDLCIILIGDDGRKMSFTKIDTKITGSLFAMQVAFSCAKKFYSDPFLFLDTVPAMQFVEHKRRILELIDRTVEECLYEIAAASASVVSGRIDRHRSSPRKEPRSLSVSMETSKHNVIIGDSIEQSKEQSKDDIILSGAKAPRLILK